MMNHDNLESNLLTFSLLETCLIYMLVQVKLSKILWILCTREGMTVTRLVFLDSLNLLTIIVYTEVHWTVH